MDVYKIINPTAPLVPMVISCPHVGTYIPEDIKSHFEKAPLSELDDTDWFIDRLYAFATRLGIPMIVATHHRWVIDLNRDAGNQPLYTDDRVITDVIPMTDFNGKKLYKGSYQLDTKEKERRIVKYYKPYYAALEQFLSDTQKKFGKVLLLDAHSIRKFVPGIRSTAFPDLILGDNDGKTADQKYIDIALQTLELNNQYSVGHNDPFKGGFITRHFGNPKENTHALQLEMAKTNYMNKDENEWNAQNAMQIEILLHQLCSRLIESLVS